MGSEEKGKYKIVKAKIDEELKNYYCRQLKVFLITQRGYLPVCLK